MAGCAMFSGEESASQPEKTMPSQVTELQLIWGVDVDQRKPGSPFAYASPALAGKLIVTGAQDGFVHIYNLQGSELRRVPLQSVSDSGALAVSESLVVLGDAEGMLYGINPQQGRIVWKRHLSSVMLGHPVRAGGDVVAQTGDNSLYRVSAKGEKKWSFSGAQSGLSMHLAPSPLVADGVVFATMSNGDVVAVRADSGDLVWRRQLLLNTDAVVLGELKAPLADPVEVAGVLVVSFYQGNMEALSARDGQQLWQRKLSLKSKPAIDKNRLFAATADGAVAELDPATGVTLWKQKLPAGELVGPVIWHDKVYVADDRGQVFALSLKGKILGSIQLPGRIDRSPVVSPEGLLLRTNLGGLYLIR